MLKRLLLAALLLCGCQRVESIASQPESQAIAAGKLDFHFLDTGNSDCIFVMSEDKNVLIDAGDNDDETLIVDYLKGLGVNKIDYLINTHPDADHSGGLDAVVENFKIENVFVSNGSSDSKTYRDFIYALSDKGLSPSVPLKDSVYTLADGVTMQFYNTQAQGSGNEVSLVTLITQGSNKFLLMGDAEKPQEADILDEMMDVDVLKVGHHGSNSSSSMEFLEVVKPEYGIITCGKGNSYGHPHQEVLERLKQIGSAIYRSDEQGTIICSSDGKNLQFSNEPYDGGNEKNPIQSNGDNGTLPEYYIGNKNSFKFHLPSCTSLPEEWNQVKIYSRDEAIGSGYEPCGRCHP